MSEKRVARRRRRRSVVIIVFLSLCLAGYATSFFKTVVVPLWSENRVLLTQFGPHGILQLTYLTPVITGPLDDLHVAYTSPRQLVIRYADGTIGPRLFWDLESDPASRLLPSLTAEVGNGTIGFNKTMATQKQQTFCLPLHLPMAALTLLAAFFLHRQYRASRQAPHLCPVCHYDVRATPTRCPECGYQPKARTMLEN